MRSAEKNRDENYVERVNAALDYVTLNIQDSLRLEDVAAVADFSPFHFHRIFRALLGETLSQFVNRVRLERALQMMSRAPERSLTEIAHATGFASSSDFSRNFKKRFGVPPSAFDIATHQKARRKELQSIGGPENEWLLKGLPADENPDGFQVAMREIPARCVAYIRVLDPFREDVVYDAVMRLMAWAESRGLADGQWLGWMWEDPTIVQLADCRYDVGVVVPDVVAEGEIGRMDFPKMTVAEVEIRGGIDLEQRALDWIFKTWLPRSGRQPADLPCFESWIGRPFAHGLEYFELHAHLPLGP